MLGDPERKTIQWSRLSLLGLAKFCVDIGTLFLYPALGLFMDICVLLTHR